MEVTVDLIRALRERTGAGIMECKTSLEANQGDLDKAAEALRVQGFAQVAKRADRATDQGVVEAYVHTGGRVGAMVELGCETDFVARTPDFKGLAHDLAMQVAAMAPTYIDIDDVPEATNGVNPEEACLMHQPFIRDPSKSIQDLVAETVGKLGENVRVRRFSRFSLGE